MKFRSAILIFLAIAVYLPTLTLPFISDDYTNIAAANRYLTSWHLLIDSAELRTRLTYVLLDGWLFREFGFIAAPFYCLSIVLHALCTLLVYATGSLSIIGWRKSFAAACFFAVFEGHQEAVMWVAASMELLLFFFGVGSLLLWNRWLGSGGVFWYTLSLLFFLGAAFSKESMWIFPILMCAVGCANSRPTLKVFLSTIPFAVIAVAYALAILYTQRGNGRFGDGSFSLHAPWLANDLNSLWHLLIIWGLLAIPIVIWKRSAENSRLLCLCIVWMAFALLPYSFLTYMSRVPSRQTYLASVGLAWLVGLAFDLTRREFPRASVFCALVALLINVDILWVKKLAQFRDRAEPTELLRSVARNSSGPIHVRCIGVAPIVAKAALETDGKSAVFDTSASDQDPLCFSVWYADHNGVIEHVDKRLGMGRHSWLW